MTKFIMQNGIEFSCLSDLVEDEIRFPHEISTAALWEALTAFPLDGALIVETAAEEGADGDRIRQFDYTDIFDHRIIIEDEYIRALIRKKTEQELLLERISRLEEAREITDEAITDLGMAISEIAEGGM